MKQRILVISDNHGNLAEMVQVINHEQANLVIHAGDYQLPINTMKQYFDYFVDGNNDFDWKKIIKFSFAGKIFLLMHGDAYYAFNAKKWHDNLRSIGIENNADIVIYGHSHIPVVDDKAKPIVVNPGSISLPRNHDLLRTYLIIEIDNNTIDFLIKSI